MIKIDVLLNSQCYPIIIGQDLFNDFSLFKPLASGKSAMLVTNDYIAPIFLDNLYEKLVCAGVKLDKIILPDGEQNKSLKILNQVFTALLENMHNRDTIIIALGGGVICDLSGFAAATYQRGVRVIQIPTTLLSQVDASIGGKTAINHVLGKNMIGAFHQPVSVLIDLNYLKTLSKREFSSGLAEVIKYAISFDYLFFIWLENNIMSLIKLELDVLMYCVKRCCELKVNIVSKDEYECNNYRLFLNLGHTYGHAIETNLGYGCWLHGEAVSVGIMMAAYTSYAINKLEYKDLVRIKNLLLLANLPIKGPSQMSPEEYLFYMKRDKKVVNGIIRLILPVAIGKTEVYSAVQTDVIITAIKNCCL